jgi:DNA-binding response OmpR family regulator
VEIEEASSARNTHEVYGATMPVPKAKSGKPSKLPTLESPGPDRRLRILLVDDSSLALAVHQHVLESAGFTVKSTTEVEGLEAVIDEWKPHLLLLDLKMPIVAGDDVCRRLKAKFRATLPIVLFSDQPQALLAQSAADGGADAYLSKTPEHGELVAFVKNILALTLSPEDLPEEPS